MASQDDSLAALEKDVRAFIGAEWKDVKREATRDALSFLDGLRPDLERWASQLAAGELDREELEFLVGAKRDLAALRELKRVGLAKVRQDKLVNGILDLAVKAVSRMA